MGAQTVLYEPVCLLTLSWESFSFPSTSSTIHKIIILLVLLYVCETWSLTLREENTSRVFQNRVQRRIFGSKREEVAGRWRRLHNEELHGLDTSPNIIRVIKSRSLRGAGM
jgi:hypothetical protein